MASSSAIPPILYSFWHDHEPPEFVAACIALLRDSAARTGWQFVLLHPEDESVQALEKPPVPASSLTPAQLSDWYRLTALRATGGVYMDATCIALEPPAAWVNAMENSVQGFLCSLDDETAESWAVASPAGDPLVALWHEEFREALRVGVDAYCAECTRRNLVSAGLQNALPYLTIHACWRAARAQLPDSPVRLASSVAANGGPFFWLRIFGWDSLQAVSAVFAADAGAHLLEGCPFMKLRRAERECVPPLASLGRGSWLARRLLGEGTAAPAEPPACNKASAVSSRLEWLLSR